MSGQYLCPYSVLWLDVRYRVSRKFALMQLMDAWQCFQKFYHSVRSSKYNHPWLEKKKINISMAQGWKIQTLETSGWCQVSKKKTKTCTAAYCEHSFAICLTIANHTLNSWISNMHTVLLDLHTFSSSTSLDLQQFKSLLFNTTWLLSHSKAAFQSHFKAVQHNTCTEHL